MTWMVAATVWMLLACGVALLVARAVHLADQRSPHGLVDVDQFAAPSDAPPVPPLRARLPRPRRAARARARTPVG